MGRSIFILFIAGLPATSSEFVERCIDLLKGDVFKQDFTTFVDQIVSNSIPYHRVPGKKPTCPSCENGILKILPKVSPEAFTKLKRYSQPPDLSRCESCGAGFGSCDVLRAEVRSLHRSLGGTDFETSIIPLGKTGRATDDATEKTCLFLEDVTIIGGWSDRDDVVNGPRERSNRLRLCQVLLLTQQHNFRHVTSCFKSSTAAKSGQCRYAFPKRSHPKTEIDANFDLIVARGEHNEYINTFNDVMALLLRSNHDVKFLVGRSTTDAFYYTMKYVTKVPREMEGLESIILACFDKRRNRESEQSETGISHAAFSKGRARVNSIAIGLSKKQSVSSTMCALYLRRKHALYTSHDFVPLLLAQSIAIIRLEEHEASFEASGNRHFVRVPQHTDYLYRPKELQELSLMEYLSTMKRIKTTESNIRKLKETRDSVTGTEFLFHDNHPHAQTHIVRKRYVRVIPGIIRPRLPDRNGLKKAEEKELYGLIALVMFFRFTQPGTSSKGWIHIGIHICMRRRRPQSHHET